MNLPIKIFYTVARLGSFSRTAEELFISQSAVSYTVKKLERELNVELFDRSNNSVRLTPAGEILYEYARAHLLRWDELLELLGEYQKIGSVGMLNIGVAVLISDYVIQNILQPFKQKAQGVDVTMLVGNSNTMMEKLRGNRIDFAFVSEPIPAHNLCVIPVHCDELALIVNRDHPWRNLGSISADMLGSMPYISREEGSGLRKSIESNLREKGIEPVSLPVGLTVGSTDQVIQSVENGLGYSFVSSLSVQRQVERGILRSVRVEGLAMTRRFLMVAKKSTLRVPLKKRFFDKVVETANLETDLDDFWME